MKKILSFILVLSVFVSFGTAAYAIGDNPTGTTVSEVPSGETMGMNNGTVTENNGTVTENNGTVGTNKGTVTTNAENGTVTTNAAGGTVTTNYGTINSNECDVVNEVSAFVDTNEGTIEKNKGGHVTTNNGTIEANAQMTKGARIFTGAVDINNGTINTNEPGCTVKENYNIIESNSGIVTTNYGTVTMDQSYAKVKTNYNTVENGSISVNQDGSESVVYGTDTICAVAYADEKGELPVYGKNYVEGDSCTLMNGSEAAAVNITKSGYQLTGWLDNNTSVQYALGETITVDTAKYLSAIWNKIVEEVQQVTFTYLKGDSNGKLEGKSFFFEKSASMIYRVKVNGKQLKEGVDYTVTEADGGIQIEFTAEFFEKYAEGELNISVVFYDNVVFKVTAVNK